MKPLTFARIALALATVVCAAPSPAESFNQLELKGFVPVNCTLNINPSAKAGNLDVLGGENNIVVGTLTESCNAGNGYVVQIVSANKGQLVNSSSPASGTDYQVQYDNAEGAIANALTANRSQAQFARQGKLTVSFLANGQKSAGAYSDTLNIIISAK